MIRSRPIVRYTAGQRINHWLVALLFLAAGLSGLALFHPWLFGLSGLFGGGTWTRILHPWFGVAMFVFFLFHRGPMLFNAAPMSKIEASGRGAEYSRLETEYAAAYEVRRSAAAALAVRLSRWPAGLRGLQARSASQPRQPA